MNSFFLAVSSLVSDFNPLTAFAFGGGLVGIIVGVSIVVFSPPNRFWWEVLRVALGYGFLWALAGSVFAMLVLREGGHVVGDMVLFGEMVGTAALAGTVFSGLVVGLAAAWFQQRAHSVRLQRFKTPPAVRYRI
jgi:hypothetical protein